MELQESASPSLGELLRARRAGRRLTQEALAELVGVSQSAVAVWENDRGRPSVDNLKTLATVLRIDITKLLAAVQPVPAAKAGA